MSTSKALRQRENDPLFGPYEGFPVGTAAMSAVGVWRWDLDTGRLEISERMRELLGVTVDHFDWPLHDFVQLLHADDRDRVWGEIENARRQRRPFAYETRIEASGTERILLIEGGPTRCTDAGVSELIGACRDISPEVTAQSRVGQLERRLSDIITKFPSMISLKDLDHRYRMANAEVSKLAGVPLEDIIGHTASEVFPRVGPEIDAQVAEAIATLETVHRDIEIDVDGQTRMFHLVTFALTDLNGVPAEVCCVATDVTESRQHRREARRRAEANKLIGSALSENRMVVVAQPVVRVIGEETVSEELLVRLALPASGGVLQPGAFLPMAERFGLIQDIDTWMVLRGLKVARTRPVQVNLSAVTLSDPIARQAILSVLRRDPDAARQLVFEITETAAAHHVDDAVEFVAALTELGCGLALDDFGTGFGSFTYLRRLPLRYLKIDRSFVTDLPTSSGDRRVVSSIISIARQFDLLTIAEGVEDAETLTVLAELGADFAQGFHLGRPEPL